MAPFMDLNIGVHTGMNANNMQDDWPYPVYLLDQKRRKPAETEQCICGENGAPSRSLNGRHAIVKI
ncbi:hypothetical protein LOY92_004093, partial [Ophidiomyces ophidiicola]